MLPRRLLSAKNSTAPVAPALETAGLKAQPVHGSPCEPMRSILPLGTYGAAFTNAHERVSRHVVHVRFPRYCSNRATRTSGLQTVARLRAINIGFRPDHLLTVRTTLPRAKYQDPVKRIGFYHRVVEGVRACPVCLLSMFDS